MLLLHFRQTQARLIKERADILSTNGGSVELFTSKEMKRATNGFAKDRVLGIGGFGEVYKGVLKDGTVVAVKTVKVGNIKGIEQVLNEVRILSQVNHRNLVRLLGFCVDAEEPLLVYECNPNRTLFDHLHMTSEGRFLKWRTRLNIALHTAEALAYLHSAAFPPIYHRDVKSTNILLDSNLNAKVLDFGKCFTSCSENHESGGVFSIGLFAGKEARWAHHEGSNRGIALYNEH